MLSRLYSIIYSCKFIVDCPRFPRIIWIVFGLEFIHGGVVTCSQATMLIICINFWQLDGKLAVLIVHSAMFVRGLFCVIGAWLADSYFGKFNVYIMSLILIILIVNPIVFMGSMKMFNMDDQKLIFITAYFISNVLSFGIECRIPLYGAQFFLPQEEKDLRRFFIILFWIINLSKFLGGLTIPLLVDFSECYHPQCFEIPFLIVVIVNLLHLIIILCYRKAFIKRNKFHFKIVERNIHLCLHALCIKMKTIKQISVRKRSFLEYGYDQYDRSTIQKAQRVLYLIPLFISILTFWSIREQLHTIWIIQSTYLYHYYYFFYAPQRIALVNPFFNLMLIPCVYSITIKHWKAYLKWIGVGFLFMCISSCISAALQHAIEKRIERIKSINSTQLHIYNTLSTPVQLEWSIKWFPRLNLAPFERKQYNDLYFNDQLVELFIQFSSTVRKSFEVESIDKESITYLITDEDLIRIKGIDPHKVEYRSKVYFMCPQEFSKGANIKLKSVYLRLIKSKTFSEIDERVTFTLNQPGRYKLYLNDTEIFDTIFNNGHIYSVLILGNSIFNTTVKIYDIENNNQLRLTWILPQLGFSSIADTLTWIPLEMFVYTQSPSSLRATIRGFYVMCECFGSGFLAFLFFFPGHFGHFLLFFSVISAVFLILYIYLSLRYRYKIQTD